MNTTVGDGTVAFQRWKGGQAVMICYDINSGSYSGTTLSETGGPTKVGGLHTAPDGRRVEWQLETMDGRNVKCRLDGKEYDLSKGSLFLVKTKGGKTEVEQVSRDLSAVQANAKSCEDFARKDPAMRKLLGIGAD